MSKLSSGQYCFQRADGLTLCNETQPITVYCTNSMEFYSHFLRGGLMQIIHLQGVGKHNFRKGRTAAPPLPACLAIGGNGYLPVTKTEKPGKESIGLGTPSGHFPAAWR